MAQYTHIPGGEARGRIEPSDWLRSGLALRSGTAGGEGQLLELHAPGEIAGGALPGRGEGKREAAVAIGEGALAAGAAGPEGADRPAATEAAEMPAGSPADREAQRLVDLAGAIRRGGGVLEALAAQQPHLAARAAER